MMFRRTTICLTFLWVPSVPLWSEENSPVTNLGLAGFAGPFSGKWLAFRVSEADQGEDLNQDGDTDDQVLHVAELSPFSTFPRFLRGDCNADGETAGVTDAVFLLGFNFLGTDAPSCAAACDANGDRETAGVTDAVYLLSFNFLGTAPPPPPFFRCGRSLQSSDRELGCETTHNCL